MAQEKVETCTITMLSRNPSQELSNQRDRTIATGCPVPQEVWTHSCSQENTGREPGTGVRWTNECTLGQELDFWLCGRDENLNSMRVGCGKSQLRH